MTIHLYKGLAGSGKTRTAIAEIPSHPNNKHLFVVPAIELADELVTNYLTHLNATAIHSGNSSNTTHTITEYLSTYTCDGSKHVLVITHASFRLMDITAARGWSVWHDEVPEATQELRVFFDQNVSFDTYFNVMEDGTVTLTKLAIESDNHDALNDELKGLIYSLKTGRFEAVLLAKGEDNYGKRWMEVLTTITASYFPDDTTLMGANVESKMAHIFLKKSGCEITTRHIPGEVENHYIKSLRIVYAMDNFNTKTLRENHPVEYKAALDGLIAAVQGDCLAVSNSDVKLDKTRFKILNHNVHGSNGYTAYKNVLFQSSLNVNNTTLSVLESRWGITADDVYMDRTVDTAYQVIMRGAIRLETPVDQYNIYVMDKRLAEELKRNFFPNAELVALEGLSIVQKKRGRPAAKKEPMTDLQRRKLCNMRKLARGGYYDKMTNFRILNNESRVVIGMDIWTKTDTRGKPL